MNKSSEKIILHCDLNNFYASVEILLNPQLKNIPLAVAGNIEARHGIILAKNEIAKKFGVKTGEAIWEAKQKAPNLMCVLPRFDQYSKYSKLAFDLYTRFTPQVEPFGADECWLDVTGCTRLFGSGQEIADKLRQATKKELGLTISVGVSFNKIFAKMGSDFKKPDGTTVISKNNYKEMLYNLPIREMFMIGGRTAEKLNKYNIKTIGELAEADDNFIIKQFGVNGKKMLENVRGENCEEVRSYNIERTEKSIGHGLTAKKDLTNYKEAETLIIYLSELIAARLRKKNKRASGVALDLKSNELDHFSRQKKMDIATCNSSDISKAAIELLHQNWNCSPPLRAITVTTFDFSDLGAAIQTSMFSTEANEKAEKLEKTIDEINKKYGANSVARAGLIDTDFIYDKNDDEDFLPFKR